MKTIAMFPMPPIPTTEEAAERNEQPWDQWLRDQQERSHERGRHFYCATYRYDGVGDPQPLGGVLDCPHCRRVVEGDLQEDVAAFARMVWAAAQSAPDSHGVGFELTWGGPFFVCTCGTTLMYRLEWMDEDMTPFGGGAAIDVALRSAELDSVVMEPISR